MKRGIVLLIVFAVLGFQRTSAQNQERERLDAYRIAFFTKRLNLTPQEAEKFWPVYNELQNKRNQLQVERVKLNRDINQNELNMTEKEMIDAADRFVSLQVQEASLTQEYHKRFREVLSPVKVIRLYQAENQYRLMLLNELRQNQPLKNNLQKGQGLQKRPL